MSTTVVVTGVGLAVPGLTGAGDLLADGPPPEGGFDPAKELVGREMRHKDRATRLALRAAEPALKDAGLLEDGAYRGSRDGTAVVVSSNYGNLDSVCLYTDVIARDTVTGLSPLGLPQTSINVITGSLAIRYGMRGPNLTVCDGAAGGLDALAWARNLIAAGRAATALVVGVEPAGESVVKLLGEEPVDGAAALVLESAADAAARGVRPRAVLDRYARADGPHTAAEQAGPGPFGLWLTGGDDADAVEADRRIDLEARLGRCSGALGVLQAAAAAAWFERGGTRPVLATAGGPRDPAAAALRLTP